MILQSLKGIIKRSSDVKYLPLGVEGTYKVLSENDKDFLIKQYIDNENFLTINFDFKTLPLKEDFLLGEKYKYKVTVKIPDTKSNFFSNLDDLTKYILDVRDCVDWNNKIVLPFERDLSPDTCKYKPYFEMLNKLICLYRENTYSHGNRLVLFTDKAITVPLKSPKGFNENLKMNFDSIAIEEFQNSILELEDFLNNETVQEHLKEKKSIFVMESAKILETYKEGIRLQKLIENIDDICFSIKKSFSIYLENFSYQRLELELKKDLDYFVKTINDSIGTLQAQALGLPIATALTQLSKSGVESDSTYSFYIPYIALITFSSFVIFNVLQQSMQVEYVKTNISRFFAKDSINAVLSDDKFLTNIKKVLNKRLFVIDCYLMLIVAISVTIIVYALNEIGWI